MALTPASPSPSPGFTMVAELGQVANWLKRTYTEQYQAPPDDPIHGNVEAVKAHEQITMYHVAALQARSQAEADTLDHLATAKSELFEDVGRMRQETQRETGRERESLRLELAAVLEEVAALRQEVAASKGAAEKVTPLLEGLPAYQKAVQDDVQARARERWGQGVIILAAALVFLVLGLGIASFYFLHYVLPHMVAQP